jgi:HK97 family phage portal protein
VSREKNKAVTVVPATELDKGVGFATASNIDMESNVRMSAAEDFYGAFTASPWIFACVRAIGQHIAGVPFRFFREVYKDGELALEPFDSPAARAFLRRPNKQHTLFDLIEVICSHLELTGDAYGELASLPGGYLEIMPISPHRMRIVPDRKTRIAGYQQVMSGEVVAAWAPEEIAHFSYFNPTSDLYGMPPALACAKAVIVDFLASAFNESFFRNDATPGLAIQYDRSLSPEFVTRLKSQWRALHGGLAQAHGVAIVDGGGKLTPMGPSHKEMAFIEQKHMSREEVLAAMGCPPIIVGLLTGETYANGEAEIKRFWRGTLLPKMKKIEGVFDAYIAPHFGPDVVGRFLTDTVPDLQENEKEKSDRLLAEVAAGVTTINEARPLLRRGGKVAWGDVWWGPISATPISDASVVAPPAPDPNTNAPENPSVFAAKWETESAKARLWKARDANAGAHSKKLRSGLKKEFERQRKAVVSKLGDVFKEESIVKRMAAIEKSDWFDDAELVNLFKVFGLLAAKDSGETAAKLCGKKEWIERPEIIDRFIATKVASAIKVNETTKSQIRDILANAADEDPRPSLGDITQRINEVFAKADISRSATIAQTETIRSFGVRRGRGVSTGWREEEGLAESGRRSSSRLAPGRRRGCDGREVLRRRISAGIPRRSVRPGRRNDQLPLRHLPRFRVKGLELMSETNASALTITLQVGSCTEKDAVRALTCATLEHVAGSRTRAAKILGISVRTLQYRIKDYGLRDQKTAGIDKSV